MRCAGTALIGWGWHQHPTNTSVFRQPKHQQHLVCVWSAKHYPKFATPLPSTACLLWGFIGHAGQVVVYHQGVPPIQGEMYVKWRHGAAPQRDTEANDADNQQYETGDE